MMFEWKKVSVSDLGRIVTGKTPKTAIPEYYGGCIPFLTPSDDMSVKYVLSTSKTITEDGKNSVKNAVIPKNSICVSCIGSDLGKVVITTKETVTNQQINSVIVNTKLYDVDFVYYAMVILGKVLNYHSKTSTAVPIVNKSTFSQYEILCPELSEQRKIARILSEIDSKIAVNTAINENLEQQAQALFKAWFVDFEPFGGVMPDDWKIISLGKLCDSISKKHKFNKDELIFLNTGDVENGMILHNNYSEVSQMPGQAKKSIAINDILYSEIRPINKHFAYVNFVADDYVVSTKLMVLRAKGISPRRLYQFLTMPDTLKELQVEAESRSGTFPQIRFDNIQQLEMIVASEQVEKEYSERLNTIYSMIDTNNSENKRLSALRDTLLPKLMNGEIDVSAVKI